MKRMIFSVCIILIFALLVLVSYAAMTREPISTSNLSDLKGKWEGWRSFGTTNLRTEFEIYNDTLPLKGKFTFHDMKRKGMMSGTITSDFGRGTINDKGNFYLKSGENYWELSLYKSEGKMKLEGDFYFQGAKGTMSFEKK